MSYLIEIHYKKFDRNKQGEDNSKNKKLSQIF